MNLQLLSDIREGYGFRENAVALRQGQRMLHYGGLSAAVEAIAEWLRGTGCKVVALRAENSIDWVLVDLACQVAELVCLPLPDFFSGAQTEHCLRTTGAELLLTDAEAAREGAIPVPVVTGIQAVPLRSEALPALPVGTQKITFTSGSTGEPKGVCLDTRLQWQVARSLSETVDAATRSHLCILPLPTLLENVAGIYASLLRGGEIILPDAASRGLSGSSGLDLPALLRCIETERPNSMIFLPQLLRALLAACERGWRPPSSLRFVAVGGARVAPELIVQARGKGLPVYEGYGLSECGSVVALNTPGRDHPGAVGRILPHCQVGIEDGEIIVSGACHLGYVGDPRSWYPRSISTGDLGSLDGRGFLQVNGRSKNVLISSYGRNISPEWIESELCALPLLTHCVVIGDGRPFLSALLGCPDDVEDAAIQRAVDNVNHRLPDYARVRAWLRLDGGTWTTLLTANGRPRRGDIERSMAAAVEQLYTSVMADTSSRPA